MLRMMIKRGTKFKRRKRSQIMETKSLKNMKPNYLVMKSQFFNLNRVLSILLVILVSILLLKSEKYLKPTNAQAPQGQDNKQTRNNSLSLQGDLERRSAFASLNDRRELKANKQVRKLLSRPRFNLFASFVPHILSKQLVLKRPNSLIDKLGQESKARQQNTNSSKQNLNQPTLQPETQYKANILMRPVRLISPLLVTSQPLQPHAVLIPSSSTIQQQLIKPQQVVLLHKIPNTPLQRSIHRVPLAAFKSEVARPPQDPAGNGDEPIPIEDQDYDDQEEEQDSEQEDELQLVSPEEKSLSGIDQMIKNELESRFLLNENIIKQRELQSMQLGNQSVVRNNLKPLQPVKPLINLIDSSTDHDQIDQVWQPTELPRRPPMSAVYIATDEDRSSNTQVQFNDSSQAQLVGFRPIKVPANTSRLQKSIAATASNHHHRNIDVSKQSSSAASSFVPTNLKTIAQLGLNNHSASSLLISDTSNHHDHKSHQAPSTLSSRGFDNPSVGKAKTFTSLPDRLDLARQTSPSSHIILSQNDNSAGQTGSDQNRQMIHHSAAQNAHRQLLEEPIISSSMTALSTANQDNNQPDALSETLRKLRETKARIRHLQAELNATDPSLKLMSDIEDTDTPWLDNAGESQSSRKLLSSVNNKTMDSAEAPSGQRQTGDWFHSWRGSNVQPLQEGSKVIKSVIRQQQSVNLPLGYHHNGPLTAPARLISSTIGQTGHDKFSFSAAANLNKQQPYWPPKSSHDAVTLAYRPTSSPILLTSTMKVSDTDAINRPSLAAPVVTNKVMEVNGSLTAFDHGIAAFSGGQNNPLSAEEMKVLLLTTTTTTTKRPLFQRNYSLEETTSLPAARTNLSAPVKLSSLAAISAQHDSFNHANRNNKSDVLDVPSSRDRQRNSSSVVASANGQLLLARKPSQTTILVKQQLKTGVNSLEANEPDRERRYSGNQTAPSSSPIPSSNGFLSILGKLFGDQSPPLQSANNLLANTSAQAKLTTERVLYTLIVFSCSLALVCLLVILTTLHCQRRRHHKRSGHLINEPSGELNSAVSPPPRNPIDFWRLRFQESGQQHDGGRCHDNKLILDGTMRNVSMLARHGQHQPVTKQRAPMMAMINRSCCHCVTCSESWLFQDESKPKRELQNLCPSGFYHPIPRGKLPFGAASSVNKFLGQQQKQQQQEQQQISLPTNGRHPVGGTRMRMMMSSIDERASSPCNSKTRSTGSQSNHSGDHEPATFNVVDDSSTSSETNSDSFRCNCQQLKLETRHPTGHPDNNNKCHPCQIYFESSNCDSSTSESSKQCNCPAHRQHRLHGRSRQAVDLIEVDLHKLHRHQSIKVREQVAKVNNCAAAAANAEQTADAKSKCNFAAIRQQQLRAKQQQPASSIEQSTSAKVLARRYQEEEGEEQQQQPGVGRPANCANEPDLKASILNDKQRVMKKSVFSAPLSLAATIQGKLKRNKSAVIKTADKAGFRHLCGWPEIGDGNGDDEARPMQPPVSPTTFQNDLVQKQRL